MIDHECVAHHQLDHALAARVGEPPCERDGPRVRRTLTGNEAVLDLRETLGEILDVAEGHERNAARVVDLGDQEERDLEVLDRDDDPRQRAGGRPSPHV